MHTVYYNQGDQTLRFVAVDEYLRPYVLGTAPTYAIVDLREGDTSSQRTIASGTATIGTATEVTTVICGPGHSSQTEITVADESGFTDGERYLISEGEKREVFILRGSETGFLHAKNPLVHSYAVGATVESVVYEATFPSAEANDETNIDTGGGPYQVTWTYTLNGRTFVVPEQVWLARYSVAPIIDIADLATVGPRLSSRTKMVEEAIQAATDDYLVEVETAGKDPAYYRSSMTARVAVRFRSAAYVYRWTRQDGDLELADTYDERFERLVRSQLGGRPPIGTTEVDPTSDMAAQGQSTDYGDEFFRES